jgi:N-acetylglucosamine-6-phosphate deacetylase
VIAAMHAKHGTTSLATTMTALPEDIVAALKAIGAPAPRAARRLAHPRRAPGRPYINPGSWSQPPYARSATLAKCSNWRPMRRCA